LADAFVWSGATGANDGSSQTDAWTALSSAAGVAAGTDVYIRGTQVLSASFSPSGTPSLASPIRWIGVNDSWVAQGTQCVIDCNSGAYSWVVGGTQDYSILKNIKIKDSTGVGFSVSNSAFHVHWFNCWADNCLIGWSGGRFQDLIYCRASNSGSVGFGNSSTVMNYAYCVADNNTSDGWDANGTRNCFQCISYDNGGVGFNILDNTINMGLIAHGNTGTGIKSVSDVSIILNGRSTGNGGWGLEFTAASELNYVNGFYVPAGGSDLANTSGASSGTYEDGSDLGLAINVLDGSDTDGGYTNSTTGDFNLATDATLFSTAVLLLDGINNSYVTAGLSPNASGGSAGGGNLIGGSLVI